MNGPYLIHNRLALQPITTSTQHLTSVLRFSMRISYEYKFITDFIKFATTATFLIAN